MGKPASVSTRSAATLPARIQGAACPAKGKIDVAALAGESPKALANKVLLALANEVVIKEYDTPEECVQVGLHIEAAYRKKYREKYGVDIRVGIDGKTLRLWKDAWTGNEDEGPIGQEA